MGLFLDHCLRYHNYCKARLDAICYCNRTNKTGNIYLVFFRLLMLTALTLLLRIVHTLDRRRYRECFFVWQGDRGTALVAGGGDQQSRPVQITFSKAKFCRVLRLRRMCL